MSIITKNTEMRILVVGAGAVGGYFGGRLAEVGRDVTFLVRSGRAESIRKQGLQIVSPHGDAVVHPKLVLAGEIASQYDLILLSVKAYGLDAATDDFAPAVGQETIILPMLNGMRHLDVISRRCGEQHVVGGVCRISSDVDSAGRIIQLHDAHQIIFGEMKGGTSARTRALNEGLQGAGFDVNHSEDIIKDMWEKWLLLASLGAITCLLRGDIGEVEAAPGGKDTALRILAECAAISAANGYPPNEKGLGRARSLISTPGSKLTVSMYRDMNNGGPVEADHILGDLIERGRSRGVECPLLEAAYANLCVYQRRLK